MRGWLRKYSARKYEDERHLGVQQCEMFYAMLAESKRPLLYIGGGLNNQTASDRIREFNRLFNIPSINSLMGKGILDESLDTSLGMLGMYGTPYANTAIQETDLFVGMGVRWDDRVAQKVGEAGLEADIAYIDINPEKVQEVGSVAVPDSPLSAMPEPPSKTFWPMPANIPSAGYQRLATTGAGPEEADGAGLQPVGTVIQQAEVIDLLSELLPEDMRITTGVGNHQMLAAQYLKIKKPKSFLTSGGFGTMGFALPCAIGAHLADPSTQVLAIEGDGSLRMNMGELHTIGTRCLPVKVLLLNNHSSGMVRNIQTSRYGGRIVATEESCREVSFANIARECGFQSATKVERKSDLRPALETLLSSDGPAFLEVVTDINEDGLSENCPR